MRRGASALSPLPYHDWLSFIGLGRVLYLCCGVGRIFILWCGSDWIDTQLKARWLVCPIGVCPTVWVRKQDRAVLSPSPVTVLAVAGSRDAARRL
eukprot:scaffold23081_cov61-Phaeocystis_antarctica.AAC.5